MFISKKHLPRRTFLKGLGVSVGLPLLDAMVPAFAATPAKSPRVGFIYERVVFQKPHEHAPQHPVDRRLGRLLGRPDLEGITHTSSVTCRAPFLAEARGQFGALREL
jgi:hypothetical protein